MDQGCVGIHKHDLVSRSNIRLRPHTTPPHHRMCDQVVAARGGQEAHTRLEQWAEVASHARVNLPVGMLDRPARTRELYAKHLAAFEA